LRAEQLRLCCATVRSTAHIVAEQGKTGLIDREPRRSPAVNAAGSADRPVGSFYDRWNVMTPGKQRPFPGEGPCAGVNAAGSAGRSVGSLYDRSNAM